MKSLVRLLLLPALLLGLAMLSACGGAKDDGRQQITFLTMALRPTFDDYFNDLIARFEEENPGVKVNWVDYPYDGYEARIITSLLGRNPADVINLSWDRLETFARGDNLHPLDELLPQEVFDSYFPRLIESGGIYDDRYYALPWYTTAGVTLYNRAIFEAAGLTADDMPIYHDDMRPALEKIRENTDHFGFFPILTDNGSIRLFLIEAGVPFFDETGTRAAFATPRSAEVLRLYKSFYDDRLVPREVVTASHRRPIELYTSGRLAIYAGGTEFVRRIRTDAPAVYETTVVGPRLTWKGHDSSYVSMHTLAVSRRSANPELAARFAAFVTNAENQLAFAKIVTIFPSVREALEDPFFRQPEDTLEGVARKLGAEQIENAQLTPPVPEATRVLRFLDEMVEQVLQGTVTPEEGLENAQRRINEVLAEAEQSR